MYKSSLYGLCGTVLFSAILAAGSASAQPMRHIDRDGSRGEVGRSARQLQDDMRDLQRFRMTLGAFDDALRRRDPNQLRGALQSFVAQGRAEVAEQQRETQQAFREARRSNWEAQRDRTWKDARDARDDRRDAMQERAELQQEIAALNELERAAAAEINWGPRMGVIQSARQAMLRFIQLAEIEVQRSRRELHEDVREMREDNRDGRRGYRQPGYGQPGYGQPGYGQPPPPPPPQPVYVRPPPPPQPVYVPPPG